MKPIAPSLREPEIRAWFRSTYGSAWLALEKRQYQAAMTSVFGTRLLQVGNWGHGDELVRSSRLLQHWVIGLVDGLGVDAVTDGTALPVMSRSVDAIVLPHALELVAAPEALIRESVRALADHGHLLITGFNPVSSWGVKRAVKAQVGRRFPWNARLLSLWRMRMLLLAHGLEVVSVRRFGLSFPRTGADRRLDRSRQALAVALRGISPGYLIVARKRVAPLTPIGRVRRPAPSMHPVPMRCRTAARDAVAQSR